MKAVGITCKKINFAHELRKLRWICSSMVVTLKLFAEEWGSEQPVLISLI